MKIITGLAICLFTTTAHAQLVCDQRAKIVQELSTKYSEKKTGYGISLSGKQMFELFTSKSGS